MPQNDQQCVPVSNPYMQMLFNNIQTINDRLQKFEKIMSDTLLKLDVLDVINKSLKTSRKAFMEWKLKSIKLKPNKMNIIVY